MISKADDFQDIYDAFGKSILALMHIGRSKTVSYLFSRLPGSRGRNIYIFFFFGLLVLTGIKKMLKD